jgi:type II secretory ATPase GspE/PulE/Tfp pilus assembly ATPase PilB-like protein
VRRICPECRKSTPARDIFIAELVEDYARHIPEDSPLKRSALVADWRARFGDEQGRLLEWHSAGCDACGGTGFKGRAGIHELLVANMDVKRLVQTKGRVEDVQHAASLNGMRTLRQDGIEKILQGVTELGEVRAASN